MYCFKYSQYAKCVYIACVFGCVKGYLYMALCRKVVYFIGTYFIHYPDNA